MDLGLSQRELARRLGYKRYAAVLRIERGQGRPGRAWFPRWLEVLKLTPVERERAQRLWLAEASPLTLREAVRRTAARQPRASLALDAEIARILRDHPEIRHLLGAASARQRQELRAALARRVREVLFEWAGQIARGGPR
jgi:transcriptional regulator with XRE-family HTH domain